MRLGVNADFAQAIDTPAAPDDVEDELRDTAETSPFLGADTRLLWLLAHGTLDLRSSFPRLQAVHLAGIFLAATHIDCVQKPESRCWDKVLVHGEFCVIHGLIPL